MILPNLFRSFNKNCVKIINLGRRSIDLFKKNLLVSPQNETLMNATELDYDLNCCSSKKSRDLFYRLISDISYIKIYNTFPVNA